MDHHPLTFAVISQLSPGRAGICHPKREFMHNSDYYREQADHYRQLAAATENAEAKQEFLELAEACEEAADRMDDCRASG
jgi:hypothetical protein